MTRIECPNCNHLFEASRDSTGKWIFGTIGGGFGAGVGAGIGESIGIALLGTAIAGTLPVAIIGGTALALLGCAIGANLDNVKCPQCNHEFKPPT
jgi:ssDNA-binding Zn-finger/Zn-ribbon topoisomerase 1